MKFAVSSTIATVVDYFSYLLLVSYYFSPITSNLISASAGMLINFFLQKKYIFQVNRRVRFAFLISLGTSLGGVAISSGLIYLLSKIPFFYNYQFITKAVVTGLVFNYNFYMKRFAFEKKFI